MSKWYDKRDRMEERIALAEMAEGENDLSCRKRDEIYISKTSPAKNWGDGLISYFQADRQFQRELELLEGRMGENIFPHNQNIGLRESLQRKGIPNEGYERTPWLCRRWMARWRGWIRACASYPLVITLFRHAFVPERGRNSPYQDLDLGRVLEIWVSPGALDNALRHAIRRGDEILRPYGFSVSWEALFHIASSFRYRKMPKGKLGVCAAAYTLQHFLYLRGVEFPAELQLDRQPKAAYRRARQVLIALRGISAWQAFFEGRVRDHNHIRTWATWEISWALKIGRALPNPNPPTQWNDSDEVNALLHPTQRVEKLGLTAQLVFGENLPFWLVSTRKGETYHNYEQYGPIKAIQKTLEALNKRRKIERKARKELDLPLDRTILVWRKDSYQAGNCRPGTQAFAERNDWSTRDFVPVDWLLPSGNKMAMAAAFVAIETAKKEGWLD